MYTLNAIAKKLKEPHIIFTKSSFLHLFLAQWTTIFVVFTGTMMSPYDGIF